MEGGVRVACAILGRVGGYADGDIAGAAGRNGSHIALGATGDAVDSAVGGVDVAGIKAGHILIKVDVGGKGAATVVAGWLPTDGDGLAVWCLRPHKEQRRCWRRCSGCLCHPGLRWRVR